MAKSRVPPLHSYASYGEAHHIFARRIATPDISDQGIRALLHEVEGWGTASADAFANLPDVRLSRRVALVGGVVIDGLNLAGRLDTARVSDWLHDAKVSGDEKSALLQVNDALNQWLTALAKIVREAFTAAEFDLPIKKRTLAAKLAQLMGGKRLLGMETGVLGLTVGGRRVYRDTPVLQMIVSEARAAPGGTLDGETGALVDRFRKAFGDSAIDDSKRRHLLRANEVLVEAGLGADDADSLMARSLELGEDVSSQPWKGLVRVFELVKNAKLDPAAPGFADRLESALTDGIYSAHRRGAEFVINDWKVARAVLDLDSRYVDAEGKKHRGRGERSDDSVIRISQAAGSVLPGIVAANDDLAALGGHYHPSLQIHLTALVTKEGEIHRAHKRTFDRYFSTSAISNLSAFIGETMDAVLDEVAMIAEANDGTFDFRRDFAFNFPIRVTCEVLGLPAEDAEMVRDQTQSAMRSLDIGAGMTQETLVEGGRATLEFKSYLQEQLMRAKSGGGNGRHERGLLGDIGGKLRRMDEGSLSPDDKEIKATLLEFVARGANEEEKREAVDAIIADVGVLVFAGFETTMSSVSIGTFELLKRPEQWEYLRSRLIQEPEVTVDGRLVPDSDLRWYHALPKREDEGVVKVVESRLSPSEVERSHALARLLSDSDALRDRMERVGKQEQMLKNAVEEMMRWTAPGSVIPLTTREDLTFPAPCDTTMEGRMVKEGEMIRFPRNSGVTVDVRAANRARPADHQLGAGGCPFSAGTLSEAPGDFDVSREAMVPAKGHLAFGSGAHVCLGANLAVENAKRMLEAILRRCPDLEIDGVPEETDTTLFMGFRSFPVRSRALTRA